MRRVHRGAFASALLATKLEDASLNRQDKGFVTDLVYGTLRHQRYLEACLQPYLKRPHKLPDHVRHSLLLASYELLIRKTPPHAAIHSWVEVVKRQSQKLSGLTNAVLRKVQPVETSEAVRLSVPDWLYQDWQSIFGASAYEVGAGMQEPEPLWVYSYHPESRASLEAEGARVTEGPLEHSLALQPSKALPTLESYQRGWIQAQNPASMLAVLSLTSAASERFDSTKTDDLRVLDLASGHGIKAALLASLGFAVTSVELSERKISRARTNLARLGFEAHHLQHDLREALDLAPFPYVLLDAPCSGTGTLRGNPEIRQRLHSDDMRTLVSLQRTMLDHAAMLTAKGGTLTYAVCALTQAEGEGQTVDFLNRHPEFTSCDIGTSLRHQKTSTGIYTLPVEGIDGFFIAKLHKR